LPPAASLIGKQIDYQAARGQDGSLALTIQALANGEGVDWGDMLSGGLQYLQDGYWWLVYPVGACLVLVVMAFNFIGDAWRDTVDVRLRRR